MTIQTDFTIRQATTGDATDLARLIDIAGEGLPSWFWAASCGAGQSPLEFGASRARRDHGGFSYANALVASADGAPVGMALSYPIERAPEEDPGAVPEPFAPFLELEAQSVGTWYVNALAAYPGHRGRGIGTRLLRAAEAGAAQAGCRQMSIQVYGQNAGALSLYRRLGYAVTARAAVRCHPCYPYYTGDVLLLKKPVGA